MTARAKRIGKLLPLTDTDLGRRWMLHVCKDGTVTYRDTSVGAPVFNGAALPVFSVDTAARAEALIVRFCRKQYNSHLPRWHRLRMLGVRVHGHQRPGKRARRARSRGRGDQAPCRAETRQAGGRNAVSRGIPADWKRLPSLDLWALNEDRPTLGPAEDGPMVEMVIADWIARGMVARGIAIPCLQRPSCPNCDACIAQAVDNALRARGL